MLLPTARIGKLKTALPKAGLIDAQRQLVDDRGVEEVVDDRRRAVRAVVRQADRLVRRRLEHQRRPRRELHVLDDVELVHARAEQEAHVLAEEDLVLEVAAAFLARVGGRRNRQVEVAEAEVAAVAHHVPLLERAHVAELEVVRVALEDEVQRLPVQADGQQVGRIPVEDVGEEVQLHRALAVVHLAVAKDGARVDVERPDAAVQDAVGAGHAALEHQLALAVLEVVVGADVQLGLGRAFVGEGRIRQCRSADCPWAAPAGPASRRRPTPCRPSDR